MCEGGKSLRQHITFEWLVQYLNSYVTTLSALDYRV